MDINTQVRWAHKIVQLSGLSIIYFIGTFGTSLLMPLSPTILGGTFILIQLLGLTYLVARHKSKQILNQAIAVGSAWVYPGSDSDSPWLRDESIFYVIITEKREGWVRYVTSETLDIEDIAHAIKTGGRPKESGQNRFLRQGFVYHSPGPYIEWKRDDKMPSTVTQPKV